MILKFYDSVTIDLEFILSSLLCFQNVSLALNLYKNKWEKKLMRVARSNSTLEKDDDMSCK